MKLPQATNLLSCITEMLGSGVGQPIEYRDWWSLWYCQNIYVTARNISIISLTLSFHILHTSSFTGHLKIRRSVFWGANGIKRQFYKRLNLCLCFL